MNEQFTYFDILEIVQTFNILPLFILMVVLTSGIGLKVNPARLIGHKNLSRSLIIISLLQYIILPGLVTIYSYLLDLNPFVSLGLLLVICCQGGRFATQVAWIVGGNIELALISTILSRALTVFVTPIVFYVFSYINPITKPLTLLIEIDTDMLLSDSILYYTIPLVIGIFLRIAYPYIVEALLRPIKVLTFIFFLLFSINQIVSGQAYFIEAYAYFTYIPLAFNVIALIASYFIARLAGLNKVDSRTVAVSCNTINHRLAMGILYTYFSSFGVMALLALAYSWSTMFLPLLAYLGHKAFIKIMDVYKRINTSGLYEDISLNIWPMIDSKKPPKEVA